MTTKTKAKGNPRLDAALLEMAQDMRGTLLSKDRPTRSPCAY